MLRVIEQTLGTAALRTIGAAAGRCHERVLRPFGIALGRSVWRLSARYRNVALKNLRFVYESEKTEEEIQDLAQRVFEHFGRAAVEFFWSYRAPEEKIRSLVRLDGLEAVPEAAAHGRGLIIITAHFGNWELLARRVACEGFPLSVVVRDCDDPRLAAYMNRLRSRSGISVISKDEPASRLLQVLKDNEMLGILPDQNTMTKPIFVPFFGRMASAAKGAALLALRARCPLLPAFAVRDDGGWHTETWPLLMVPQEGTMSEKILKITADFTRIIELQIRKYPEQWLWFHDRWRRRPGEGEVVDE